MSNTKRSDDWISLFAFLGILLLIATFAIAISVHMEITTASIILALLPSIIFWSWLCLDLWRHNGRPRYIYRWIDLDTGNEVQSTAPNLDTICIRQKISGWGGKSEVIVPDHCVLPNVSFWSIDQSSTLREIALVDTYGVVVRTNSLENAMWVITHAQSVGTLLEHTMQDAVRLEQYGRQRDELIGAFLCLERLVDKERDTFGNSPYGVLVRHYANVVLRRLLEQDVDLTRSVFVEKMDSWQHLADQCITRFGRR